MSKVTLKDFLRPEPGASRPPQKRPRIETLPGAAAVSPPIATPRATFTSRVGFTPALVERAVEPYCIGGSVQFESIRMAMPVYPHHPPWVSNLRMIMHVLQRDTTAARGTACTIVFPATGSCGFRVASILSWLFPGAVFHLFGGYPRRTAAVTQHLSQFTEAAAAEIPRRGPVILVGELQSVPIPGVVSADSIMASQLEWVAALNPDISILSAPISAATTTLFEGRLFFRTHTLRSADSCCLIVHGKPLPTKFDQEFFERHLARRDRSRRHGLHCQDCRSLIETVEAYLAARGFRPTIPFIKSIIDIIWGDTPSLAVPGVAVAADVTDVAVAAVAADMTDVAAAADVTVAASETRARA